MQKIILLIALVMLPVSGVQASEQTMIRAITEGDLDEILVLAKNPENLLAVDHTGKNALMVAAKAGDATAVSRLLALGASPTTKNANGGTALMFAAISGDVPTIELFLDKKVDVDLRGSNGWGALMIAAAKGHVAATERLLEAGASINTRDVYQWTPLHRAAYQNQLEVVELLLQNQDIKIDALDDQGATALHHAAARGWVEVAGILLTAGANAEIRDVEGRTALNYAAEGRHGPVARLLHDHKKKS